MKRYLSLALIIVLIVSLCACTSRPEQTPESTVIPSQTPETKTTPKPTEIPAVTPNVEPTEPVVTPSEPPVVVTEPPYRSIFTGEGRDTPNTSRPFAVMINDLKEALPQRGIASADILYEILAEGGVTRMMGIFSDAAEMPEDIGPVRSIRPYYVDVAMAYGAVAVHAGYSDAAINRISTYGVDHLDGLNSYADGYFYRDQQRRWDGYAYEHTLFIPGEKLYACAEKRGFELGLSEDYDNGLRFTTELAPAQGEKAEKIDIKFSGYKSTALSYGQDSGKYTIFQHGTDLIDENIDDKVEFTNVLILYARTSVVDDIGRLNVTLTGTGTGYFACNGQYEEISWSREHEKDCFRYTRADGSDLELAVGTTYIAVLPTVGAELSFR